MKLKEIINAYQTVNKITDLNYAKLGVKTRDEAKKIIDLKKRIDEEVKLYERLNKDLAINAGFVQSKSNPAMMEVDDKNPDRNKIIEDYNKKHTDLLESEIDLEMEKIKINWCPEFSTKDELNAELFFSIGG